MKVQEDRWYLLRWKERSLKVGTYKWNWTRMVLKKWTDRGFLFSSLLLLHVNSVFREDLRLLMMSREVESGLLRVGSYKWSWTRIVWMKYPDGEYISWTWTLYALKACSVKVWYCWWCLGEGKKGWWRSKGVRRWGGEEVNVTSWTNRWGGYRGNNPEIKVYSAQLPPSNVLKGYSVKVWSSRWYLEGEKKVVEGVVVGNGIDQGW